MNDIYEDQALRFIDALALGIAADEEFAIACRGLGLDPGAKYDSPMLALVAASAQEGTAQ